MIVIAVLLVVAGCQASSGSATDCDRWSDVCWSINNDTNCAGLRYQYDLDRRDIERLTDEAIANAPPSERRGLKDDREVRKIWNARRVARMKELGCDLAGLAIGRG